ncbi:protein D3-like [Planococcus citri]|uniref:protein D3-like n=1 Tax=Planococcus citri TaxID=170843 RepID=UPI0031FA1E6A
MSRYFCFSIRNFKIFKMRYFQLVELLLPILLFSLLWSNVQSVSKMDKDDIVPDAVSVAPEEICSITYPSGSTVNLGNELAPAQVKDQPVINWKAENDKFYTLFFIDPDAPSRADPKLRQAVHWLVSNIPGSDISKGEVLTEFIGSGPPQGTGLHRYTFLIYKQPGKIDLKDHPRITNKSVAGRFGFKVSDWTAKYNLGNPVAGNYYQAQFDDYVPILHKQLGL